MTATNEFTHLIAILATIVIVSVLLALFFLAFDAPKVLAEAAFIVAMASLASIVFSTTITDSTASDDLSTYPHYDKVKTIYANNIGANVTYIVDNKIYTGGTSAQNRTKNENDENHTLKLAKGEADITKKSNIMTSSVIETGLLIKLSTVHGHGPNQCLVIELLNTKSPS